MSVFTEQESDRLAALTFRFRPREFSTPDEQIRAGKASRPLLGKKKVGLLAALQAAEQRYLDCIEEVDVIKALRRSERELPTRCAMLVDLLAEFRSRLVDLDVVARTELDVSANWLGSSAAEMHKKIDDLMTWLQQTAEPSYHHKRRKSGRKKGKNVARLALEEFAKEMRLFLTSNDVGMRFGYEEIVRDELETCPIELVSPAARLLFEAAKLLNPDVQIGDIKPVMTAVRRSPEFRKDFVDDAGVDALTK